MSKTQIIPNWGQDWGRGSVLGLRCPGKGSQALPGISGKAFWKRGIGAGVLKDEEEFTCQRKAGRTFQVQLLNHFYFVPSSGLDPSLAQIFPESGELAEVLPLIDVIGHLEWLFFHF